jgi:hypothetical protein
VPLEETIGVELIGDVSAGTGRSLVASTPSTSVTSACSKGSLAGTSDDNVSGTWADAFRTWSVRILPI